MELLYLYNVKKWQVRILGIAKLKKLRKKNIGNNPLVKAIDQLIKDIKDASWTSREELQADRNDADRVHVNDFYFFDINIHRTIVLVEFSSGVENNEIEDEIVAVENEEELAVVEEKTDLDEEEEEDNGSVQILWVGSHEEYERTFKNDKNVIEKWLRNKGLI